MLHPESGIANRVGPFVAGSTSSDLIGLAAEVAEALSRKYPESPESFVNFFNVGTYSELPQLPASVPANLFTGYQRLGCLIDLSPALLRRQLSVTEFNLEAESVGHPPGLNDARSRLRLGPGNPQDGGNLGGSHARPEPIKRVAGTGIVEDREAQDAKDGGDEEQPEIATEARHAFRGRAAITVSIKLRTHGTVRELLPSRRGKPIHFLGL
jgi:hypothetical protein